MSNVDVVERCLRAIEDGDAQTLAELSTEDVEIRPLRALLEDTVYRGRAGILQWIADLSETWAEMRFEVEEFREPAPDQIVAVAILHNRGHGSDVPITMRVELAARFRDGLVSHARVDPATR